MTQGRWKSRMCEHQHQRWISWKMQELCYMLDISEFQGLSGWTLQFTEHAWKCWASSFHAFVFHGNRDISLPHSIIRKNSFMFLAFSDTIEISPIKMPMNKCMSFSWYKVPTDGKVSNVCVTPERTFLWLYLCDLKDSFWMRISRERH